MEKVWKTGNVVEKFSRRSVTLGPPVIHDSDKFSASNVYRLLVSRNSWYIWSFFCSEHSTVELLSGGSMNSPFKESVKPDM